MDQFIGEIRAFPYNFAPRDWALCNGQLLPISSNTALFSVLGTTYGGDGRTTFALPDLVTRVVPGTGQGPGLSAWELGEAKGAAQVALQEAEMPMHNHNLVALNRNGTSGTPAGDLYLAKDVRGGGGVVNYMASDDKAVSSDAMSPAATTPSGNGQPHENCQPYLAVNFCIALEGEYPARE